MRIRSNENLPRGSTSPVRTIAAVTALPLASAIATLVFYPQASLATRWIFAATAPAIALYALAMGLLFFRKLRLSLGWWAWLATLLVLSLGEIVIRAGASSPGAATGAQFVMDRWNALNNAQRSSTVGDLDCRSIMTAGGDDLQAWTRDLYRPTELTNVSYPIDPENRFLLSVGGIDHTLVETDNHDLARRQWMDELRRGKQLMRKAIDSLAADARAQALQQIDHAFDTMMAAQLRQDLLADATSQAMHTFLTTARGGTPGILVIADGRYQANGPLASRLIEQGNRLNAASALESATRQATRRAIQAGLQQLGVLFYAGKPGSSSPLCGD